jgi:hypothetical protein
MIKTSYPPDKTDEVGRKYLENLEKIPHDENLTTQLVLPAVYSNENGICTITIDEVKTGKLEEALNHYTRLMIEFRNIVGFRYEIKSLLSVNEALPLIGMGS